MILWSPIFFDSCDLIIKRSRTCVHGGTRDSIPVNLNFDFAKKTPLLADSTMELGELERSVKRLGAVLDEFPIGAISLDDFKPIEVKIRETRESLKHLNARSLMLKAKYKRMSLMLSYRLDCRLINQKTKTNFKCSKLFFGYISIQSWFLVWLQFYRIRQF